MDKQNDKQNIEEGIKTSPTIAEIEAELEPKKNQNNIDIDNIVLDIDTIEEINERLAKERKYEFIETELKQDTKQKTSTFILSKQDAAVLADLLTKYDSPLNQELDKFYGVLKYDKVDKIASLFDNLNTQEYNQAVRHIYLEDDYAKINQGWAYQIKDQTINLGVDDYFWWVKTSLTRKEFYQYLTRAKTSQLTDLTNTS